MNYLIDEEERKRRMERANAIINSINGNKINSMNNYSFESNEPELQTRIDRANQIIQSINPTIKKNNDIEIEPEIEPKIDFKTEPRMEFKSEFKPEIDVQQQREVMPVSQEEKTEDPEEFKGFLGFIKKAARDVKDALVSIPVSIFNTGTGIGATISENKKERSQKLDEMEASGEIKQSDRTRLMITDTLADTATGIANGFIKTATTFLNFFAPNEDAKVNYDYAKIGDYSPLKDTEKYGEFNSKEELTQHIQDISKETFKALGVYNPGANAIGSFAGNMISAYALQKVGMPSTGSYVTTGAISSLGQTGDITQATRSGITNYAFGKILDSSVMTTAISSPVSEGTRKLADTLMTRLPNLQNSNIAKSIVQELPNIASDFSSVFVSSEAAGQIGAVLNEQEILSWDTQKEIAEHSLFAATVLAGLKGWDRIRFDIKKRKLGANELKAQLDKWYETLGLEKNKDYTVEEIEKIRKQFAKKYHPDINSNGTERMQAINNACDELEKYIQEGAINGIEITAKPEKNATTNKNGLSVIKNKDGESGSIIVDTKLALNEINRSITKDIQKEVIVPIQENGEVVGFDKKEALPIEIENINPNLSEIKPGIVENENGQTIDLIDTNTGAILLSNEPNIENAVEKATQILTTKNDEVAKNIKRSIQEEENKSINAVNKIQNNIQQGLMATEADLNADKIVKSTQQLENEQEKTLTNETTNNMSQNQNELKIENESNKENKSFEDVAYEAMQEVNDNEIQSPLQDRNIETIGQQTKVNAYQYDNPEAKPYFQEMAQMIGEDLSYISNPDNRTTVKGGGTKLSTTTSAINTLHNEMGYSYNDIAKGLQNIIEDNGKENNAISKKLEIIIDEQLRNGYTNALGQAVAPNQEYINTISKQGQVDIESNTSQVKNSLGDYSGERIKSITSNRNAIIVQNKEDLKSLIKQSFEDPNSKKILHIGTLPTETILRIKNEITQIKKEKIDDILKDDIEYSININQDEIRHLTDKEGMTVEKAINFVLEIDKLLTDFDSVSYHTYNNNQNALRFKKKIKEDTVIAFDVISNIKKSIRIQSIFFENDINKNTDKFNYKNKKGRSIQLTPDDTKSPSNTSKTDSLSTSSINNSIPQKPNNVKNTTVNNKDTQKSKNNTNIQDFGEKIGGARKDLGIQRNVKPGKEVIHDYTVKQTEEGYSVDFKGKTLKDGFKSQEEAEKYILDFKNDIKNNRAFVKEYDNNRYLIYLRNPRTLKYQFAGKEFSNKQDAESYAMALSMYLKEYGKNLFRPQIQKVERTNPNIKNATKATGDNILNDFGFRAGEFGNWVAQNERQQFLNYAQDAFSDLAEALGVSPKSLGQKNAMAIAFGARGTGLTGAVAHFEPGKKVINMTRLKGAGSLAHEYGHSIDNYLSREGGYDPNGMVTSNIRNPKLSDKMKNAIKQVEDAIKYNVSTNEEEINKKNAIYEKNRISSLEYNLHHIDKVFSGEATTYKYNRKTKQYDTPKIEVTEKQKAEYQEIRNVLMKGEIQGEIDYKISDKSRFKTEKIYPEPISRLQQLYKEVVGRKLDDDTVYSIFRQGRPTRQVTEVKSESAFSKSALELDKAMGRASAYFSRTDEMWARAFESYVYDKLKAKGITNTYLVHSVNNDKYSLFNPFPAGEERQNINKAFDNLIQVMKEEGMFTAKDIAKQDDGIRYMKKKSSNKTKEFKQNLAKQFEDMTGDSILLAGAKLGGIELRNRQRELGNLQGKREEIPYSREAMKLYKEYQNSQKTSSYLYHATSVDRLKSIMDKGLTIGNKQNQEGVSAFDKIYLSATPELAESFAPANSVTLRINPRFYDKLENFEEDFLGGKGSYSITNNIPADMLQIKENGKWINLKDYKGFNQKSNIQGLEDYTRQEIKDIASNYIQEKIDENYLDNITIKDSEIIGSRNRGDAKSNSDLDIVVEYDGDIREDDLFNVLNEEPLEIEGIKVDINPITANNTGTLQEYLERAKQYDKDVIEKGKENILNAKKTEDIAPGQTNAERADAYIEQEIKKIEESGKWDDTIPVTSRTDIRKTIEDYLGLGIKKGRFRQAAFGIYKTNRGVIRTKELKDMDTILHETGHALDNKLKLDKENIADELIAAVNALEGYEEETREIQLEEGFAEVIREYSIIPEQARIEYPQTVSVIEQIRQADVEFNKFMTKLQKQTYNYIHQNPQNRVHSNQSIGKETDKQPLTKEWIKQEAMRLIYDKDYIVKSAVNETAKISGKSVKEIKASQNAYYLTRLASGIGNKVTSILSEGYIDEKGNKIIPGLSQIGEILGDDLQRYNDLRDYLVAKRDLEYKAKTLKTGIRTMDSQTVIDKFKNDKQIQDASQLVYDTLDGVLQYAVDNHLISEEIADGLRESNAFYVPFQRVIEGRGNTVGRRGAVTEIIKKRTGSELDVKDVLENIVTNSANIIQQVENNNILKAFYKAGEQSRLTGKLYDVIPAPMTKVGTAQFGTWANELKKQGVDITKIDFDKTIDIFVPNNKVDTKNLITSFINDDGNRVYLQFNDEMLFNSLMGMDKEFMSKVLKINSKLNMPLRYGATMANIGFAIPNMISDTVQAAIYSEAGFIPVVDNALGVIDILAATNKTAKKFIDKVMPGYSKRINKLYTLYQQSGATSATRLSQYRESAQGIMKEVYGTKNSETLGIKEKYKPLKRLLDLMTYIPELSEQSTRFRVFEKNYEAYKNKGNSETDARILAALESRDATQDFGRTGNLTREINQLIPFSAARVGSAYTFAEKVKANPKRVAMRTAILLALAMTIKAIGNDDKEIEELNQRKKDDNFVLKVGEKVVTIKKPQGTLRSIINLTEYIQDLFTGHIKEGKEAERLGEWINNAIMDNMPADSITGLVPNMVAPLIENAINKDFYYNTDIVKSWDLDLPDSDQYYDYNSQLAILLGKIFNYSPAKIDNLISGYFGGLGTQIAGIMDSISGKMGLSAEKPNMGAEQDAVGKRFVVNVNTNSTSIDEIYSRKTELTKKKNGGTITDSETKELETITTAVSNISNVNKEIKEIKKSLTTSGEEKAEQIRELQKQKTDLARQALGKELIHEENTEKLSQSQFYPNNTLSKNNYTLALTAEMKKEYQNLASEYYNKYAKTGLYSEEKLKDIASKAKTYAKNTLMQKYKNNLEKRSS